MCGRMNITDNEGIRLLMDLVGMPLWPTITPRFNVAPTQTIDVLLSADDTVGLQHQSMHWGIVPTWAKPDQFQRPLINARSETVREKPSFRHLIDGSRCLVPVTGFYEWHRKGSDKRPFYIYPGQNDGANSGQHRAMFFGALYQRGKDDALQTTLLTTAANETMANVHHRMPVIIEPQDCLNWLAGTDRDEIDALMQPASNDTLAMHEVSSYVSNARNQGPDCSEPLVQSKNQEGGGGSSGDGGSGAQEGFDF